jgi:transcriptional regulator with XRE-family HTH domain
VAEAQGYLRDLLARLRFLRERANISESELEERLILGPGWIRRFESGITVPSIDMLLAILHQINASFGDLLQGLPEVESALVDRWVFAEQDGQELVVHFRYADHDAQYRIASATVEQYEEVIKVLRDGLARLSNAGEGQSEAIKTDSVARCFLRATARWPHANPSDLWWFVVSRAYGDPYNHPARFARLDFNQSWKRTGGWALEEILVRHYAPFLKLNGVNLFIADGAEKKRIIEEIQLPDRAEADKIDVVLTGDIRDGKRFFGVVHVKASFAERRTDDVPLSRMLLDAGYTSIFWTMDCKSGPSATPINRGELGAATGERSAKRKDIEDQGYFSGCFSYNSRTVPSRTSLPLARRIYVCNFGNPDDEFSSFILARWREFQ